MYALRTQIYKLLLGSFMRTPSHGRLHQLRNLLLHCPVLLLPVLTRLAPGLLLLLLLGSCRPAPHTLPAALQDVAWWRCSSSPLAPRLRCLLIHPLRNRGQGDSCCGCGCQPALLLLRLLLLPAACALLARLPPLLLARLCSRLQLLSPAHLAQLQHGGLPCAAGMQAVCPAKTVGRSVSQVGRQAGRQADSG